MRSNVRTAAAAQSWLQQGLTLAFRAGAITGMLVAGLALLARPLRGTTVVGRAGDQCVSVPRRLGHGRVRVVDAGMTQDEALTLSERVRNATHHAVSVEAENAYFVVVVTNGSVDTWAVRDEQDWQWMRDRITAD